MEREIKFRGKRSKVDFSNHILTEIKGEDFLIHKFWQKDTCCYGITFINSCGILAITGDCGNWILCREFHPSAKGSVSDGYWCEKLRIASTQSTSDYDAKATEEEIRERLQDEDLTDDIKEYLLTLLKYVDEGEFWYQAKAHEELPEGYDHESVPYCKKLNPMLEVVFDAFDEICRRMKESDNHELLERKE